MSVAVQGISPDEFSRLFEAVAAAYSDALLIADQTGCIIYWNRAAEALFGYAAEEALGQDLHGLLAAPDQQDVARQRFARFLSIPQACASPRAMELTARRKDGGIFPAELTISFVLLNGSPGAIGLVRDLSVRKRSEQLAESSRQRFEGLVNTIDGIVWEADIADHRYSFVSRQTETLLGYPAEDWLRPGFWDQHVDPRDRARASAARAERCAGRGLREFEYRFLAADGRSVWLRDTGGLQRSEAGPVLRGLLVDVTDHKLTEQTLEEAETKFRTLVEESLVGVYVVQRGRFVYLNRRMASIFGYEREEMLALSQVTDIVVPEDRERMLRETGRQPDGRERVSAFRGVRKDGAEIVVETVATRVEFGGAGALLGTLRDITVRVRAEENSRKLLAEQQVILDNALAGIVYLKNRIIVNASRRFEQIFGYGPGEMLGQSTRILYPSVDDFEQVGEEAYIPLAQGRQFQTELILRRKDGSLFWGQLAGQAIDPADAEAGSIWVYADVDERRHTEEALLLAATVFENSIEGIVIADAEQRILKVNRAFTQITGYESAEVVGKTPRLLRSGRHGTEFYREMWAAIDGCGRWQGEIWNRRKDGEIYPEWLTISVVEGTPGGQARYIGVFSDITQHKRAQDLIEHLAHHDALTSLPNRALMDDRLEQAITHCNRYGKPVAVLVVDIDRFKNINDTLGHRVGDGLLSEVALRLRSLLRDGDTVSRHGGDEFAVLLTDLARAEDAGALADKILGAVSRPISVNGQDFVLTASIGVSLFPLDGADGPTLLKNADAAMYHVKEEGGNAYQFFTADMNARALERLTLEHGLRRALERQEFVLYYQPQVDFETGRVIGVEALVRWRHPEMGMIPPDRFIPLAEETGLIVPLGEWVLQTACARMQAWHAAGYPDLRIAVNLSARQFKAQGLMYSIERTLQETGLPAGSLELELTESMLMQNPEKAVAVLQSIKSMGVQFSVDDFGTGYSSLTYLKRFPLDKLKIDRSFVRALPADPNDAAIAQAVIALAKSLNLQVVAEGVETAEQWHFLRQQRCHSMQGYYFSAPLPEESFEVLLAEGRSLQA